MTLSARILFTIIIANLFVVSCRRDLTNTDSISVNQKGEYEMLFIINTLGKTKADAMKNAKAKVFENIFFVGTPNTINNIPFFENGKKNNQTFFDDFIKSDNSSKFITSIYETTFLKQENLDNRIKIETKITVNIESLRRYLQNEGILRKFGY